MTYHTVTSDAGRATVNMTHNNSQLTISQDEATRVERDAKRRLLRNQKLSLVVDLDQTIIHATVDPTVADWQSDVDNPNHEAVKDVRQFKLKDEGAYGRECSYYIKLRPGLDEFLREIAKLYELHIYTMGTRAYARHIAKIVDPDRKIFGDRILSRDESGSLTAKNLERLFPVDTKMVVIIDDRGDVWKWSDNLIRVTPYDFFVGIGDINSSFLPKKPLAITSDASSTASDTDGQALSDRAQASLSGSENGEGEREGSTLDQLLSMSSEQDSTLLEQQASERTQQLASQLEDRPLLRQQKKLDAEEGDSSRSSPSSSAIPSSAPTTTSVSTSSTPTTPSSPQTPDHLSPHRHHLLQDTDTELHHLGRALTTIHTAFFTQYASSLALHSNAQTPDELSLSLVPSIPHLLPRLKRRVLSGLTIVLSGVVPLGVDVVRSDIALWAQSFGARISLSVRKGVTHVVAARERTQKVRQAARLSGVKVVRVGWLIDSLREWRRKDETAYLVRIHPDDVKGRATDEEGLAEGDRGLSEEDVEDSNDDDDEDDDDDRNGEIGGHAADTNGKNDDSEVSTDLADVMPDDLPDDTSPIDGFTNYDWKAVDDDLAEFLGSDAEDDSDDVDDDDDDDDKSEGDRTPKKRKRERSVSRSRSTGGMRNGEDSGAEEAGSRLAKRREVARNRTTGLKTVATVPSDTTNDGYDSGARRKSLEEIDDDEFTQALEAEVFGHADKGKETATD